GAERDRDAGNQMPLAVERVGRNANAVPHPEHDRVRLYYDLADRRRFRGGVTACADDQRGGCDLQIPATRAHGVPRCSGVRLRPMQYARHMTCGADADELPKTVDARQHCVAYGPHVVRCRTKRSYGWSLSFRMRSTVRCRLSTS